MTSVSYLNPIRNTQLFDTRSHNVITIRSTETPERNLKNVRHYRRVVCFEFYVAGKFNNLLFLRFGLIIDFRQLGDETGGAFDRNENSNRRLEWSLFYVSAFRFCSPIRSHRSVRYLLRNSFCPTLPRPTLLSPPL